MVFWMILARLLHVLSAFMLVSGMLGRGLTFAGARQATDVVTVNALLQLSERFERLLVRPGSEAVFVFGLATAWLQRQPLLGVSPGGGLSWLQTAVLLYVATVPLVIIILVPRTRQRKLAADLALQQRHITPDLRAALNDRLVLTTRSVELAIILVVLVLMVAKPF